jgi:putative redox protein
MTITWDGDLRFQASPNGVPLTVDGKSVAGPSPVQALALALAGCMAVDVVDILVKGRYAVRSLATDFSGQRADETPHRFVAVALHFHIAGDPPAHAVERAIALSHDKYCSVWHSLRQDITFETSFEVTP